MATGGESCRRCKAGEWILVMANVVGYLILSAVHLPRVERDSWLVPNHGTVFALLLRLYTITAVHKIWNFSKHTTLPFLYDKGTVENEALPAGETPVFSATFLTLSIIFSAFFLFISTYLSIPPSLHFLAWKGTEQKGGSSTSRCSVHSD